jgi:putative nucleotidyltransferase with HDIG domain
LRTPLDPDITFSDDPLRMLRLVRFAAKYGWQVPFSIIKSLKRNASKLKNISSERIQDELNKILVSSRPQLGIKLLQITGLLKEISPELDSLRGMKQNKHHDFDVFKHTTMVLTRVKPDIKNRLAALFHDVGKSITKTITDSEIHFYQHEDASAEIAEEILRRLKYPNDIIEAVVKAVKSHMRTKSAGDTAAMSDKSLRKLKNDLGDHLELTLDLIDADNQSHSITSNMPNQVKNIRQKLTDLKSKDPVNVVLPLNGFDIQAEFHLKQGKEVGKVLKFLKDKYFENPFMTREEAIELINQSFFKK